MAVTRVCLGVRASRWRRTIAATPSTRRIERHTTTTQADAWDGWLDDADAVVFAGTSFSVQVTRRLSATVSGSPGPDLQL